MSEDQGTESSATVEEPVEDFDEFLDQAEDHRRARSAYLLVGKRAQELLDEHDRLDRELADAIKLDATENREPLAPGLAAQVAAIESEMEAAKREFRLVAIGRKAWADLVAQYPPTDEDREADPGAQINSTTFPPVAIAMSCESPRMTVAQVERLERILTDGQWTLLWNACLDANMGGLVVPKSALAGSTLRASERFATIASLSASLDPSSSAA